MKKTFVQPWNYSARACGKTNSWQQFFLSCQLKLMLLNSYNATLNRKIKFMVINAKHSAIQTLYRWYEIGTAFLWNWNLFHLLLEISYYKSFYKNKFESWHIFIVKIIKIFVSKYNWHEKFQKCYIGIQIIFIVVQTYWYLQ